MFTDGWNIVIVAFLQFVGIYVWENLLNWPQAFCSPCRSPGKQSQRIGRHCAFIVSISCDNTLIKRHTWLNCYLGIMKSKTKVQSTEGAEEWEWGVLYIRNKAWSSLSPLLPILAVFPSKTNWIRQGANYMPKWQSFVCVLIFLTGSIHRRTFGNYWKG